MDNTGKEKRVAQIRSVWQDKEIEYLLEVWRGNDRDAWTDETFEAIASILQERLGEIPQSGALVLKPHLPSVELDAGRYLEQARAHFNDGKLEEAVIAFNHAIQLNPGFAPAHYERGLALDEMERLEEAIAAYCEAVRLDPAMQAAWENLRDARAALDETLDATPAGEHLQQAMRYIDESEFEKALVECERALSFSRDFPVVHYYNGLILEEMGRINDAILAYQTAIGLNRDFYAASERLSVAWMKWEALQYRLIPGENELLFDENTPIDFDALPDDGEIPAYFYLDEKAFLLRGVPGHRILPGRSGYDPLDNDFEVAHIQGVWIRKAFTGKLRTREPLYLLMMAVYGILFASFLFVMPATVLLGSGYPNLGFTILIAPYSAMGIALLVNVFLSLTNHNLPLEDGKVFY